MLELIYLCGAGRDGNCRRGSLAFIFAAALLQSSSTVGFNGCLLCAGVIKA